MLVYGLLLGINVKVGDLRLRDVVKVSDLVWFGLVRLVFIAYQLLYIIHCQILFIHLYQIYKIWFNWVL